jgi:hypothetical protein
MDGAVAHPEVERGSGQHDQVGLGQGLLAAPVEELG